MRRYQLFEFLDQPWLPSRLRGAATAYLTAAHATTPFPALWAGKMVQVLKDCELDQIVDLGSGSRRADAPRYERDGSAGAQAQGDIDRSASGAIREWESITGRIR